MAPTTNSESAKKRKKAKPRVSKDSTLKTSQMKISPRLLFPPRAVARDGDICASERVAELPEQVSQDPAKWNELNNQPGAKQKVARIVPNVALGSVSSRAGIGRRAESDPNSVPN